MSVQDAKKTKMKLKYQLTEREYIDFTIYHHQSSKSYKKQQVILRYILPLVFTPVIYWIGTVVFKQPSIYWIIISLAFYLYWAVPFNKRHRKLLEKEVKRNLAHNKNDTIFGEKILEIEKDILKVKDELTQETITKDAIVDVVVNGNAIYVYISSVQAVIIVDWKPDIKAEEIVRALKTVNK